MSGGTLAAIIVVTLILVAALGGVTLFVLKRRGLVKTAGGFDNALYSPNGNVGSNTGVKLSDGKIDEMDS